MVPIMKNVTPPMPAKRALAALDQPVPVDIGPPKRISAKVRAAIDLMVSGECKKICDAAAKAGLARESLSRALSTPHRRAPASEGHPAPCHPRRFRGWRIPPPSSPSQSNRRAARDRELFGFQRSSCWRPNKFGLQHGDFEQAGRLKSIAGARLEIDRLATSALVNGDHAPFPFASLLEQAPAKIDDEPGRRPDNGADEAIADGGPGASGHGAVEETNPGA